MYIPHVSYMLQGVTIQLVDSYLITEQSLPITCIAREVLQVAIAMYTCSILCELCMHVYLPIQLHRYRLTSSIFVIVATSQLYSITRTETQRKQTAAPCRSMKLILHIQLYGYYNSLHGVCDLTYIASQQLQVHNYPP